MSCDPVRKTTLETALEDEKENKYDTNVMYNRIRNKG